MASQRPYRLGVDLGTTFTSAAISQGAGFEPLSLSHRSHSIPSVVAVDGDAVIVGEAAEAKIASDPTVGVREPKRRFGDATPIVIGGAAYEAHLLMAALLAHVVAEATDRMGNPPTDVILTHPADWGDHKLDLLRAAATEAGVADPVLVAEPVAAALAYVGDGRVGDGAAVAVYDFGGGTFDAAVIGVSGGVGTVLGTPEGRERVGGLDIDALVLQHVNESVDGRISEFDGADPAVARGIAQLRTACVTAKESLSDGSEAVIPVTLPGLVTEVRLTRPELESKISEHIVETVSALDRTVASAGRTYDDLAGVLLVGGSTRIPVVAETVGSHTGRPVFRDADPKMAIAGGAATGGAPMPEMNSSEETAMPTPEDEGTERDAAAAGPGAGGADESAPKKGETKASNKKKPPPPRKPKAAKEKKTGLSTAQKAAGAVAGVAAAGAGAAAGAAFLASDEAGAQTDVPETDAEESMDAFDSVAGSEAPSAAGTGGSGGVGGGGGVGPVGGGTRSGEDAGRRLAPDRQDPTPSEQPQQYDRLDAVKGQLSQQLEGWAPEGVSPEQAAEVRAELLALVDRYEPAPGQTVDQAIEQLKFDMNQAAGDFADDLKIDALIEEQLDENQDQAALDAAVERAREQLHDRINELPLDGVDAAEAAEFREELRDVLDNYVPVPGSTDDQALFELERRFNAHASDWAQEHEIEALVEELRDEDDEPEPQEAPSGQDGAAGGEPAEAAGLPDELEVLLAEEAASDVEGKTRQEDGDPQPAAADDDPDGTTPDASTPDPPAPVAPDDTLGEYAVEAQVQQEEPTEVAPSPGADERPSSEPEAFSEPEVETEPTYASVEEPEIVELPEEEPLVHDDEIDEPELDQDDDPLGADGF